MKNVSIIGRKLAIYILGFWAVLCFTAADNAAEEPKKNASEPQQYQVALEKAMENYFNFLQALSLEKGLTKEEKEKKAIAYANKFRFGPEQKDYLILVNLDGTLVMDPYQPQLDGQNLLGWEDPNGQQPFKKMTDMMKANPEGYIGYLWPKYGGEKPVPTVAYLKAYQPFGWFAGAVAPITDVEAFSLFGYAGAFVTLISVDIDNQGASSTGGNR